MNKTQQKRIDMIRAAIDDLEKGLKGEPFVWGDAERRHKEHILACLDYVIVSESRLKRGGHELKRMVEPIGTGYFGSPIRKLAKLYLLGVQTQRTSKFYDLLNKGKALVEYQVTRREYSFDRDYFGMVRAGKVERALRQTNEMMAQLVAALDEKGLMIDPENGLYVREQIAANAALLDEGKTK